MKRHGSASTAWRTGPPAKIWLMDPTFSAWLEAALAGITWLDFVMAFVTAGGLGLTLRQALKATEAASAAREAVASTRASLMGRDLVHYLQQTQGLIKDANRAIDDEEVAVSKHVLVQLSESIYRAVALAEDADTPVLEPQVLNDLKAAALQASDVKVAIAKAKTPKTKNLAKDLTPILSRLSGSLVQYDAIQKFATPEVS